VSPPVLRVGVVGLGEIAQYMHLPHLTSLPNIKVTAMCDLSPSLVERVADKYGVAKRYTSYLDLLEQSDVDAVFVATRDHPPVSIAAAEAGKHVMSEKPIAFNLEEADAVIAAARENKVKLQIAYMKRYDPAFEWALPRFKAMQAVGRLRLIRLHDFGGDFGINEKIYNLIKTDDIPGSVIAAENERSQASLVKAIGEERRELARTYSSLLHLCTHDATILRGAFGDPKEIQFVDCYANGFTVAIFDYGDGVRCVWESGMARQPVPWDESLTAYGTQETIRVQFPFPYLHNAATTVHLTERGPDGEFVEKTVVAGYDEAFRREWKHFYECVSEDRQPRTSGEEARADVAMLAEMVKKVRR